LSAREGGLVGVLDEGQKTVLGYWVGGAQGLLNNFFALVEEEAGAQLVGFKHG
jgi:transposase-like protein